VIVVNARSCPKCQSENPRFLNGASDEAMVNFYRCDECGHVWTVQKSNPDGPTTDVTLPPKKEHGGRFPTR
jgi:transposase-like protein